jgi:uncharacterized Zn finger protein (UPF0148 family)
MTEHQCKSCGNPLNSKQTHCQYCGSSNPIYKSDAFKQEAHKTYEQVKQAVSTTNDDGINVCLLIVLIIVFWPAAIVYAIIKMKK